MLGQPDPATTKVVVGGLVKVVVGGLVVVAAVEGGMSGVVMVPAAQVLVAIVHTSVAGRQAPVDPQTFLQMASGVKVVPSLHSQ